MQPNEVRTSFIQFFRDRGHVVVPSAPLVPKRDPTLLFTSAGMVQFKPYFEGRVTPPYKRAVSIQKCLRVSDLERVGDSPIHHTFFEMPGNFSFGDYFKKEALAWAWEYVTKVLGLPPDNLYVSVFKDDDEAYRIWRMIGVPDSRISRRGEDENFWGPAGKSGPCGPSSEILWLNGDEEVEIWNIVFNQYFQHEDGTRVPLDQKGIDTGLGFERVVMILENKGATFDTSLFTGIIQAIEETVGRGYEDDVKSFRIIADHIRALVFAVTEGVFPSNEGRGYVVRRLIRRAIWAGYNLGVKEPFLYRLIGAVINSLKEAYPEITTKREQVGLIIKSEEERFLATLERGKKVFEEILRDTLSSEKPVIPGDKVFKLYDTYGLPPEMTRELASTHGVAVDMAGFKQYLKEQRQQARSKAKFLATGSWVSLQETGSEFVGYNFNRIEAHIIKYRQLEGDKVDVVLDKTPFYAESGGQVGDKGRIYNEDVELEVYDTQYEGDLIVHRCKIIRGGLPTTRPVLAEIDTALRKAIAQHHTATHLLQAALKRVLGDHVRQEGSLVAPTHLRFDFTHYKGLTDKEIEKVETLVNEWIQSNLPVEVYHTTFKQAVDDGAIYIVGEEYKDPVRVVKIGDISRELCGGTHLNATGEIGLFKILNESSIHAGIRRIEAVAGMNAWRTVYGYWKIVRELTNMLKSKPESIVTRVAKLESAKRELERLVDKLRKDNLRGVAQSIAVERWRDLNIIRQKVDIDDRDAMRLLVDILRETKRTVGVIVSIIDKRPFFLTFVSDDLTSKIKAGELAKIIGKLADGGGGGKSHLGEAGGKSADKVDEILSRFTELVEELWNQKPNCS